MRCGDTSVTQMLVGLHRVGIVGLPDALKAAATAQLVQREAVVNFVVERLRESNYVPDSLTEEYRTAVWREHLRSRGEDFSEYFSHVAVTVKGAPGEALDAYLHMLTSVLAGLELRPDLTIEPEDTAGPNPQIVIGGEAIARGFQSRRNLERAVRITLSHW